MMDIDKQLLLNAQIKQESGGDPNALSPKGAAGIMQIMPDTARDPGYGVKPLQNWDGVDPRTAPVEEQIRFGNDYREAMARQFGGDQKLALAAYNAGPGAVEKYGGIPPYQETQDYVRKISNSVAQGNAPDVASQYQQVPQQNLSITWDEDPAPVTNQLSITWDEETPEPSFMDDMSQNFKNREMQSLQAKTAYFKGEQSLPETIAQQGLAYASTVPDALLTGIEHVTPQFIKDAGSKAMEGATFLAGNTVGKLPVGFGSDQTMGEAIPELIQYASEGKTREARNLRAAGQALNLIPTAKAPSAVIQTAKQGTKLAKQGAQQTAKMIAKRKALKQADLAARKKATVSAADMGKLARESYDEASYLGAKFEPGQVGNKIDGKLQQLKAKPLPNGKLTTEDLELNRHIDELEGMTGRQLSLDDVQRLDESLGQKINKFVDPKTGQLDANGRKLYILQKELRDIVDEADVAGNNALVNGRHFYRAQMMMNDLENAAERAAMNPTNPGKALQREYKKLYLDKKRTKNWPADVKAKLKKAGQPGMTDEVLDFFGSRLPALIGYGSGNMAVGAGAHMAGIASRGAKDMLIAKRGSRVQQSIVDNTMKNVRKVDIPQPTPAERLLLPAPNKMGPKPMTDIEIKQSQKKLNKPTKSVDNSGRPIALTDGNKPKPKRKPKKGKK